MKKASFYAITIGLTLLISVGLGELLLRANGFDPWRSVALDAREPTMNEPHPVYGWRSREGDYVIPAYEAGGDDIHYTFLANGVRRTGPVATRSSGTIVLVGGSYTLGWAVSDEETWGWKLQERFPDHAVLNFGIAGYGTVQSLLVLERELPRIPNPRVVVYGFVAHHEVRNVAPARWLRSLAQYSRRGHVDAPFATLDSAGNLVAHPPERYLALPLRESLAIVAFLERVVMDQRSRGREAQGSAVTEAALRRMAELSREHGATFVVALLRAKPGVQRRYAEFLRAQGIAFVDGVLPLSADMRVPGEGHPNGRAHSIWSERLAPRIAEILASPPSASAGRDLSGSDD